MVVVPTNEYILDDGDSHTSISASVNQFQRIPFRSNSVSNADEIIDVDVAIQVPAVTQNEDEDAQNEDAQNEDGDEDDGVTSQLSNNSTLVADSGDTREHVIQRRLARIRAALHPTPRPDNDQLSQESSNMHVDSTGDDDMQDKNNEGPQTSTNRSQI